jgi:Tfp pilus assembly protein PilO
VKGSDKAIVMGVIVAVFLAGFYFKVLSPKREEAATLKQEITQLQAQVDEQKQVADFAEDARRHFPAYYGRLVVLGKAVPSGADTPSLLVQLNSIANRTGVKFNGLQLSANSEGASASAPTASSTPSTSSTSTGTSGTSGTTPTSTSTGGTTTPTAVPTEANAASLPIGAAVGPAGLPTMPYDLTFEGQYFNVADFLKGVDELVHMGGGTQVAADGRLLTVDGFALAQAPNSNPSNPTLKVSLSVTSYVTPADQGLTAGASPSGPGVPPAQAQPASTTVTP